MIMANFCQTAGNAAQGEEHAQMNRHKDTHTPSMHMHTQKMQEDTQLLIELM